MTTPEPDMLPVNMCRQETDEQKVLRVIRQVEAHKCCPSEMYILKTVIAETTNIAAKHGYELRLLPTHPHSHIADHLYEMGVFVMPVRVNNTAEEDK